MDFNIKEIFIYLFELIEYIYEFCLEFKLENDNTSIILINLIENINFHKIMQNNEEVLLEKGYFFYRRF